jgi:hypothetical protein
MNEDLKQNGYGGVAAIGATVLLALMLGGVLLLNSGGHKQINSKRYKETVGLVEKWADHLDRQTTATGVYVRPDSNEISEEDEWGTKLRVEYSQGGLAENVTVRSAGPDRRFHTTDDIETTRVAVNGKGIGEGIKQNAAEVSKEVAKGIVEGTAEGIKETAGNIKQAVADRMKKFREKDKKIDEEDTGLAETETTSE